MERVLREPESRMNDRIYLKVTVAGKSPKEVNKTFFYLDITDEIDKIVSERYGSDSDNKENSMIDLKNLYVYLTKELKLGFFLKDKSNVRHTCLELEGELYADNIDIYEFKRFVVLEWGEIIKLGFNFFGVNKMECRASVGHEFLKNKVQKTRKITGDRVNITPKQDNISVPQIPNIPDPFPTVKPESQQNNVKAVQQENKIPDPFDSNGNVKNKKSKIVEGDW